MYATSAIKRADGVMKWRSDEDYVSFHLDACYYRIAQFKPWYRVALFNDGICIANRDEEESQYTESDYFIKWLTDRIPYDN